MIGPADQWTGCELYKMLTGKGGRILAVGEGERDEQGFAALRPPSWLSHSAQHLLIRRPSVTALGKPPFPLDFYLSWMSPGLIPRRGQDSEARTRPSQARRARLLSPGC